LSNSGVDRSSWSHAHVYIWSTLFIHNTLTNWHRTIHDNCSCSINGFIYSTTVNESIMDTFFVLFILFLVLHSFIDSFVRSLVRTVFERFTYWHSIVYNWFRQNNRMRTNWKSWQNTADEIEIDRRNEKRKCRSYSRCLRCVSAFCLNIHLKQMLLLTVE
jgi:hypothetical protein